MSALMLAAKRVNHADRFFSACDKYLHDVAADETGSAGHQCFSVGELVEVDHAFYLRL